MKKEGFFQRNQPKFEVNGGELDVSNKSSVSAKLIGINPRRVEYLDEDGDLWDRGNYGSFLGMGIETTSDDKEKKKEARKSARILNYYSTNVTSQYSTTSTSFSSRTKGTDIRVDDSKKIGVIVDKNLIVTDVLEKNFFPNPYYGVEIRFVDE